MLADLIGLNLAIALGYLARFEGGRGLAELRLDLAFLGIALPVMVACFWYGGIYRILWRHASTRDFVRLGVVGASAGLFNALIGLLLHDVNGQRVPLSVLTFTWLLTILGPAMLRGVRRLVYVARLGGPLSTAGGRRVLVAGAGEAGRALVDELRRSQERERMVPVGFVDDDPVKASRTVSGIPVLGTLDQLAAAAHRTGATGVLIAMPRAAGITIRRLTEAALAIPIEVRTLPGLLELATGRATASALRKVEITDLLRREPVTTDLAAVRALVEGRRVLVTGAGGSIGSELCRQLARCNPEVIGLLGHGENSIFEIQRELLVRWPELRVTALIADIRNRSRMETIFAAFKPAIVFHAAAHKHVPLMEDNIVEAVTNNVLGTWNVADLATEHGVERLVMISSDKAVHPTSVMGTTKRVAEQLLLGLAADRDANAVMVRFGNVLGSRGSVVPTFQRQIAEGGPVTLTDPAVRRYFMTIPEAVQLVLQASVLGARGEIFALDMGEPILIADLANDLIRLSGLEPGRDIEVLYTGLRPGEKMYEEVFFVGDGVLPTLHPKIMRVKESPPPRGLIAVVRLMAGRANAGASEEELQLFLQRLVPEYRPTARAAGRPAPHLVGPKGGQRRGTANFPFS